LQVPLDLADTESEVQWRQFLNRLDGWPTALAVTIPFSDAIEWESVTAATVQLWRWGPRPERLEWQWLGQDSDPAKPTVQHEGTELRLYPPRQGWRTGHEYVLLVRQPGPGDAAVLRDRQGRPVRADRLFVQLRDRLTVDNSLVPKGFDVEKAGQLIDRFLEYLEMHQGPLEERLARDQLLALTSFTTTSRPEIVLDHFSQRGPLPCDIMLSPEGTVNLPVGPDDHRLVQQAKQAVAQLDGAGLSGRLVIELTAPLDPTSVTLDRIALFDLSSEDQPLALPLSAIALTGPSGPGDCQASPVAPGCRFLDVEVQENHLPLAAGRTYAVVLFQGLRDEAGAPLAPMPDAQMLRSEFPLLLQGRSQRPHLPLGQAARLEPLRLQLNDLLHRLGRESVLAAWPFTTMTVLPRLHNVLQMDPRVPPDPFDVDIQDIDFFGRFSALEELFPGLTGAPGRLLYASRLNGVGRIVRGSLWSPYRLDPVTRRFRPTSAGELEKVHFIMAVPEDIPEDQPLRVAIFGHSIVTDRRFLLTVAGPLAQRGVASIAIDFPFHGDRTVCVDTSLVGFPNLLPGPLRELTGYHEDVYFLPPCLSGEGATCSPTGQCFDAEGQPEGLNSFLNLGDRPAILDLSPAAGAAFLNVNDLAYVGDHVLQTLIDLNSLKGSLTNGNWEELLGVDLDTEKFYYFGQSLGSIVGSILVALTPDFERAVFNVPGADLVRLYLNSSFLARGTEQHLEQEELVRGSSDYVVFETLARWMTDRVDPHSVVHLIREQQTRALIQMDTKPPGDFVIPNSSTRVFERVSGLPVTEYNSNIHFDLILPGIGDDMLEELVDFLTAPSDQR
jgi:hypothetical protein